MPRLDEPIKVSSRPPWLEPRAPFWRHQFAGGNAFMLTLLKQHAQSLEANAEPEQFDRMLAKARQQLGQAASIQAQGERDGGRLVLRVTVENLTGHKFPTGHPYRRAWLHVRVSDAAGRVVFESGAPDQQGRIQGLLAGSAPHYDVITEPGQVQIYEAVMADAAGQATRSLLGATSYLKDNRLPPHGFRPDGPEHAHTAVRGGAAQDANFNADGSGSDTVTYRLALEPVSGPLVAEVALFYQSVPPEAVEPLFEGGGSAAVRFKEVYSAADRTPETVQRVRTRL